MANKKISQLAGTVPQEIVSGSYLFASAAGNVGVGYETKKITAQQIAQYAFTGAEGELGFPATQLSGTKNIYFNNSNWVNSTSAQPPNFGYLMLRTTDGLLTTGSGIATPVDGDNLGDHTATQPLNMANNDIINADDIRFYQSSQSIIAKGVGNDENLVVKGGNELILKGNKHVLISGLGLDLASIPISGAVTFSGDITVTGANLEIDPANKLIANEIEVAQGTATNDSGVLLLKGAMRNETVDVDGWGTVYWNESNIQYDKVNGASATPTFDFGLVNDGQTLTMSIRHTQASNTQDVTPTFTSGSNNNVFWGAEYDNAPPVLIANKTNVYTFVAINTGIFASAITGYEY